MVMNHLIWVQEIKLRSSTKAITSLSFSLLPLSLSHLFYVYECVCLAVYM